MNNYSNGIIVDTSALIAFFLKSEIHHLKAQEFIKNNRGLHWIITESVFDETVTWFRAKFSPQV